MGTNLLQSGRERATIQLECATKGAHALLCVSTLKTVKITRFQFLYKPLLNIIYHHQQQQTTNYIEEKQSNNFFTRCKI